MRIYESIRICDEFAEMAGINRWDAYRFFRLLGEIDWDLID